MSSIDSFINGDNLCQALECVGKILDKNILKMLNQQSSAAGSNDGPFSSKFFSSKENVVRFSSNLYSINPFRTTSRTNNRNVGSKLKGDRPFSSREIKVRLIDE